MEDLFAKLKGYLHMESELPFEEFSAFYKEIIAYLNASFAQMDQKTCLKARYICSIVQANADTRARTSKATAKAFKKMSSKCIFWADAINFRLLKEGLSQEGIDGAMEEFNQEI